MTTPAPDPARHAVAMIRAWAVWRACHPGQPVTLEPGEVEVLEAWADAHSRARDAAEPRRAG